MNPHFIADGGTKHIEAIADNVWKRACNALHDWLYDDYEDDEQEAGFILNQTTLEKTNYAQTILKSEYKSVRKFCK